MAFSSNTRLHDVGDYVRFLLEICLKSVLVKYHLPHDFGHG